MPSPSGKGQGLSKVQSIQDSATPLPWIAAFSGTTNAQFLAMNGNFAKALGKGELLLTFIANLPIYIPL